MKENKTNAMRLLERAEAPYTAHAYPHEDGAIDAVAVAGKLGQDPRRVFKTLVTQGHSRAYYVFVIPAPCELDPKAAARAVGEKSVEMIPVKDINKVTGYIRGGCSPIGMKKAYPTVFDQSATEHETLYVSAGRIGLQIEAAPDTLIALSKAKTASICHKLTKL